ncbi:hypothetical protein N9C84_03950 [Desulfobacterales bacterium]|nr:hypothetical protein [Desulfobacterales bacterium]
MNRGWVKLYRKSLETGWMGNHVLWALWTYLLLKASHKEHALMVGNQKVHLKPGQLVFGREKAAKELKVGIQQIRSRLAFLRSAQKLTIKATNRFSIITIMNWDTYQYDEREKGQQDNHQSTTKQPQTRMLKNEKNKDLCPFEDIRVLYNSILDDVLPTCRAMTKPRMKALNARWNEKHRTSDGELTSDSLEYWQRYFEYVKSSRYLTGHVNDWRANFDWLTKKANFIKVIENQFN